MNVLQSLVFDEVCHRRILRRADVRSIEALYNENATVSQTEIAALLTINQACFVQDPAWGDFLVEALVDYVTDDLAPIGTVTAENVEWLISAIAPNGQLISHRLRECAVRLMSSAAPTPTRLRTFVLACLRTDLESQSGATASLLSRQPEAVDRLVVDCVGIVLNRAPNGGLELTRAELDEIAAISHLAAVANSGVWHRTVLALSALSLLERASYEVPSIDQILMFISDDTAAPWTGAPLQRLSAEAIRMRGLERQRTEILLGESIAAADGLDYAVAWGDLGAFNAARQQLVEAGFEIPAESRRSRAADAA